MSIPQVDKALEAKRSEGMLIHNLDEILLPPEERSGRMFEVADVQIQKLANSIAKNGQQQPIKVRRLPDKRVELVSGRNRLRAIKLLRERGDKRPIRAEIETDINEEQAFLRTIDENLRRSAPSFADDAQNHRLLRQKYGWTDTQIAKHYEISVAKVTQLKDLLLLPTWVIKHVHDGDLGLAAALKLLVYANDEEQLKAAIELATNPDIPSAAEAAEDDEEEVEVAEVEGDGKAPAAKSTKKNAKKKPKKGSKNKRINGAVITQLTRSKNAEKGKVTARNSREIREAFEGIVGGPGNDPAVRACAKKLRDFCAGKGTDKLVESALDMLLDAARTNK